MRKDEQDTLVHIFIVAVALIIVGGILIVILARTCSELAGTIEKQKGQIQTLTFERNAWRDAARLKKSK